MSVGLGKLNWNNIENPYESLEVPATDVDGSDCNLAKEVELHKLKQFDTYEDVKDTGQKTVSTRWVITNKNGETRARLAARGFEEKSLISKDSPTIGKETIRIYFYNSCM